MTPVYLCTGGLDRSVLPAALEAAAVPRLERLRTMEAALQVSYASYLADAPACLPMH